jgi:2-polyprenyl-3-methyl-5-hydroxy-6-metoxy-1,4-benzoquinol methylase
MKYPTLQLTNKQELEIKKFNQNKKIRLVTLNCINCKSLSYKELYANDRHGINQQTVMCNTCGLVYSNPRMSKESLNYFYSSNLYREVYETSNDFEYDFSKRIKQVEKNIRINKPNFNKYYPQLFFDFIFSLNIDYKTVCEIGAGYGTNLLFFKNIGKEVFGLEPSKTSTKIATDNQINVKQGFINELDNKYDMIMLKHVLEHLYDPLKDLEKIRSHANKYLFIEVPGNIKRIASIQNAHNFYFTENTLHKIVTKAGFNIISTEHCKETEFIFSFY